MAPEVEMDIADLIPPLPHFICPPPGPQTAVLSGGDLKTLIPTCTAKMLP